LPETEEAVNFFRSRFDPLEYPQATPLPRLTTEWKPRAEILTYEEITRVAALAASMGVNKIRLTGGEPLLRAGVERLVRMVARLPGVRDLALTCNGFVFAAKAAVLKAAGLRRVSFSLDSLDRDNFCRITGCDGLQAVFQSIQSAQEAGLNPIKVNAVIVRGLNDHEIENLAEFAHAQNLCLRFLEFMPLDAGRLWSLDLVVPAREILARLQARFELRPLAPGHLAETARRRAFADGRGELGIIAAVTEPFCGHCNRLRLTADGKIRTCLFSLKEHDLKPLLRGSATDDQIREELQAIVRQKEEGNQIGAPGFQPPTQTMSCIGG
jgi:cyclic pyranopterin phosphate synthase